MAGRTLRLRGLLLAVIAYNLGNLLRRLALPLAIQNWSLTSLQQRLFKTGGRLIRHARYFTLQLAESYLTGPLFRQIVARMARLGLSGVTWSAQQHEREANMVHIGNPGLNSFV